MIYEYFRVALTSLSSISPIKSVPFCKKDVVQGFDTRWDEVQLSINDMPSNEILESLYRMRIEQKDMAPSYPKLKTMVKRFLDQKTRAPILRTEMKGPSQEHRVKARAKGNESLLNGSRAIAISGKQKGKCTKGRSCSFRHDENKCGNGARSSSPASESPMRKRWKKLCTLRDPQRN